MVLAGRGYATRPLHPRAGRRDGFGHVLQAAPAQAIPLAEAVEPRRRTEDVDRLVDPHFAAFGGVPAAVAEHVDERVPDLARRLQDAVVVAVGEDLAAAAPELVEGARDADREALHAARAGCLGPVVQQCLSTS
ncbi:MAG: hypothetical protein FJ265_04310 [Planctomycetes bacterium]|nr:hypothetical protein [Planctomycetota bacterium]